MLDHEIIKKFKEFQKKTGKYKDLKIEDIRFNRKKISDIIIEFIKGRTPKYSKKPTDTIVIKSGQARGGNSNFNLEKKAYLDINKVNNPKYLKKGDILINTTGVGTAGRVTLFSLDGKYVTDSHITALRYDLNKFNKFYILYFFINFGFKKLENLAKGTGGQIELSMDSIRPIDIPIPKDLNETYTSHKLQEIIVEFLEWGFVEADKIKEVFDKRADILKRAKQCLIPSVFKKDYVKKTFAKYAKEKGLDYNITDVEFEKKRIINYINMQRGKVIAKKDLEPNGKYPVYSSQTKNEGLFGYLNNYMYDGESITWTTDGKHAGTTFLRKGKFNYTNVCGLITVKESHPIEIKYLFYLTKLLFLKHVDRTSQNSKLMTHHINKIFIFVPKPLKNYTSLDIQKHIADFIDHYMNIIDREEKRINQIYNAVEKLKKLYLCKTFRNIKEGE